MKFGWTHFVCCLCVLCTSIQIYLPLSHNFWFTASGAYKHVSTHFLSTHEPDTNIKKKLPIVHLYDPDRPHTDSIMVTMGRFDWKPPWMHLIWTNQKTFHHHFPPLCPTHKHTHIYIYWKPHMLVIFGVWRCQDNTIKKESCPFKCMYVTNEHETITWNRDESNLIWWGYQEKCFHER